MLKNCTKILSVVSCGHARLKVNLPILGNVEKVGRRVGRSLYHSVGSVTFLTGNEKHSGKCQKSYNRQNLFHKFILLTAPAVNSQVIYKYVHKDIISHQ